MTTLAQTIGSLAWSFSSPRGTDSAPLPLSWFSLCSEVPFYSLKDTEQTSTMISLFFWQKSNPKTASTHWPTSGMLGRPQSLRSEQAINLQDICLPGYSVTKQNRWLYLLFRSGTRRILGLYKRNQMPLEGLPWAEYWGEWLLGICPLWKVPFLAGRRKLGRHLSWEKETMKTSLLQDFKGHGQEGFGGNEEEDVLGTVRCTLSTWFLAGCLPFAPLNLTLFRSLQTQILLIFLRCIC